MDARHVAIKAYAGGTHVGAVFDNEENGRKPHPQPTRQIHKRPKITEFK